MLTFHKEAVMVFGCANKQEANKDEIDEKKKKKRASLAVFSEISL